MNIRTNEEGRIIEELIYRHQDNHHASRPMRILYRPRKKTGPETLPTKWVEEVIDHLENAKRIVGIDPFVQQLALQSRYIDTREEKIKMAEFIHTQYGLLIDRLHAWIKRYKF